MRRHAYANSTPERGPNTATHIPADEQAERASIAGSDGRADEAADEAAYTAAIAGAVPSAERGADPNPVGCADAAAVSCANTKTESRA